MGSFSFTRPTRLDSYYSGYWESTKKKDKKFWSKAIDKEIKRTKNER